MRPRIRPATVLDLEAALAMKDAAWRETYTGLVPAEVLAGLDLPALRGWNHDSAGAQAPAE